MKYKLFPLLYLLCIQFVWGQDSTYYNKNWQEVQASEAYYLKVSTDSADQVVIRSYYMNQQLRSREQFIEGRYRRAIGEFYYFHPNGKRSKTMAYQNGMREGSYREWYESGHLKERGNYLQDKLHGLQESYYENRQLKRSRTYRKGVPYDQIKSYYPSGHLTYKGIFSEKGIFKLEEVYTDEGEDLLPEGNGPWIQKNANGALWVEGFYKEGYKSGEWILYDTLSQVPFMKVVFDKGIPNHLAIMLDKEGKADYQVELEDFHDLGGIDLLLEIPPLPMNIEEVKTAIGYPEKARDLFIEGKVVARVLMGKDGRYSKHRIISQVHPMLVEGVEAQLPNLRFSRAVQGSQPIKFWVNIPFNFKLLEDKEWKRQKRKERKKKGS
ncbi:MAG: energy transducer TonB [Bacteroidota bacterium]